MLSISLSGGHLSSERLINAAHLSIKEVTGFEGTDQALDVRFMQKTLSMEVEDRLDQGLLPLSFLRQGLLHSG